MDHLGKGWIVMMRNDGQDAALFDRDWVTYQNGFGDLNSNFWLGNEFLHQITKDKPHELHVDLRKPGSGAYVFYSGFQVANKDDGYRLTFDASSYVGTGGNSLPHHNNMRFSTPERDLDPVSANCAAERKTGWWFHHCSFATPTMVPIHWGNWSPQFIDLKLRAMSP
ncbi:ficolin-1-like [Dendronephthya gigantea]|uniref:ficolin-1-like n=1 Tax=Dendronephthya gigantea TaxID=151771 RepID=UPI00106CD6F6|nr:ficolin-1-like [Dendronephthya gigantea]